MDECSTSSSLISPYVSIAGSKTVVPGVLGLFFVWMLSRRILTYREEVRKRVKQVQEDSLLFSLKMTRVNNAATTSPIALQMLELDKDFVERHRKNGWSLVSLGEYMASLRPEGSYEGDISKALRNEMEAALAAALLKLIGPNMGRVFLPAIGLGPVQGMTESLAAKLASEWMWSTNRDSSRSNGVAMDKGFLPVSILTVLSFSDRNAQVQSKRKSTPTDAKRSLTAIERMKLGEIGVGPCFGPTKKNPKDTETRESLVPNPFVVSRHFTPAVKVMEELIATEREKRVTSGIPIDVSYDPDGRSMPEPVAANPRLLPGLHLGWGAAKCTHTHREIVNNRLLSVLLNRLGANYHIHAYKQNEDIFALQMTDDDNPITTPSEFVRKLIESGHHVTVCPRTHVTSFGLSLSIKEEDKSWSNIPIACFLESGYEDMEGNAAAALMPHSGLDMDVVGPLVGFKVDGITPNRCTIQHFSAIDGFCGWHSNHLADVPWLRNIDCGTPVSGEEAIRATRLAALYANILNGLATKMQLPLGGYGLTGVCNDSAALLQQCMYGSSSVYPMSSIGRFLMHTLRYAREFRDRLAESYSGSDAGRYELFAIRSIIEGISDLPCDLHAAPSNIRSTARRMLHCLPDDMPFLLMHQCRDVMTSILKEEDGRRVSGL